MIKAIIPLKTDSKELPRKNFLYFCGQQMYEWAVQACLDCQSIDEVYISISPCPEAREIKAKYPAVKIIDRPQELNGDVELLEVMKHAAEKVGKRGDIFVQVQANKPLTKASDLRWLVNLFREENLYSLFTIQKIRQALLYKKENEYILEYKEGRDRGEIEYFKSCAIAKIWTFNTLKDAKKGTWGIGEKHLNQVIDNYHIEIDSEEDFKVAEALKRAGF